MYFIDNLFKEFIIFSKVPYFSVILFALKVNNDLRFCVDYRKLNAIIKRNRYLLSLIKKVIKKIIEYKYLTRLNIIAAFNKLRINLSSEDLIIFITTTSRKGVIYLVEYLILYYIISSHGTISRGVTLDHFERYKIRNY